MKILPVLNSIFVLKLLLYKIKDLYNIAVICTDGNYTSEHPVKENKNMYLTHTSVCCEENLFSN